MARTDEDMWRVSINEYWRQLSRFHPEAIGRAFDLAPVQHPDWFPTAGQMIALCSASQKSIAIGPSRQIEEEKPFSGDAAEKIRKIVGVLSGKVSI